MPLWLIYHPPNTFTSPSSKQALSADITKIYTSVGLPAFYVIVNFIPVPSDSTYIGGRPNDSSNGHNPFIRIQVDHIAVRLKDDDAEYARVTAAIDRALKPHIADKGYDWEYHVDETERRLWKIQGLAPPPHGSEAEKGWAEANVAAAWE